MTRKLHPWEHRAKARGGSSRGVRRNALPGAIGIAAVAGVVAFLLIRR